jgi:hypothetical protein
MFPSSIHLPRTAAWLACLVAAMLSACGGGGDATLGADQAESFEGLPPPTSDAAPLSSETTSAVPSALERESPAALGCPAPAFARAKVAAWDMSRDTSQARRELLAHFDFAVVGMSPTSLGAFASGIKQLNPNTKIAQYINVVDLKPTAASSDENYPLVQELQARGWWLATASGQQASWTGGATAGINLTAWTKPNPDGQRWPEFKARYDAASVFAPAPQVEYAFTANTLVRPRVAADWQGAGSDQPPSDPTVQSAMRAGYAAYWSALRTARPGIKLMAGTDSDLASPEYKGQADAAFLDGMIGKPWSIESWGGWDAMMRHYRSTLGNLKPGKTAVFSVFGASPTDYAAMRYGFASALLDDGDFMFRPASGSQVPVIYDEYLAALGKAVDAPPLAAASNGIWLRRYENGLVLVNPQIGSASIDIGAGYRRLAGTQDPVVNNGQAQQQVTLGARQGLVMLKVPPPCVDLSSLARPRVAALDYSFDTSSTRRALLARFDYAILGLTKTLGASNVKSFVSGIKALNPAIRVGQYTAVNELNCDMTSSQERYPLWQEVQRNGWWLRNAAGQRVQWSTAYGACELNISAWAPRNAAGQSWAQFKWQFDDANMFSLAPFDFMFVDNIFGVTRTAADWQRNGIDLARADPTASAALRAGHVAYWNAVRATKPTLEIIGNADNDLSSPEYKGNLDGAFLEGSLGMSWSRETWAGWDNMMNYYRGALRNTRHAGMVFLNAFAQPTDYATVRYGLASAMLEDGYFVQLPPSGRLQPSWFDEFGAPIGVAAEAPPTAPAQNGIWLRRYANGLVLVNPSKTASASIDVGAGYKRLAGTQDPTVNNGQQQQVVTLGPRQGLLMLRQ